MSYIGYSGATANIQKLDTLVFSPGADYYTRVNGTLISINSASSVIISVGGVILEPFTDYNVVSSRIYFAQDPTPGLSFFGISLGKSIDIGVPSDNSVTNSKIAGPVSIAKGGTGASTADSALSSLGGGTVGISVFKSPDATAIRTQLNLGSAAIKNAGTLANNVLLLADNNKLPVLDGSNLTNLPVIGGGGTGSIGVGQTWVSVLGSRNLGTSYYNASAQPIMVSVSASGSSTSSPGTIQATCNGVVVGHAFTSAYSGTWVAARGFVSFIVPPAGSYSVSEIGAGSTITVWSELR